ncbi:MAG TPA: DinB family protein [Acidimicrobiales bacterium]|nr:DinB family protein [Acidimicrobiales bacterium]
MNAKTELLFLFDTWQQRFVGRIADLTDEEFWSDPAPDCWRITPDGAGGWTGDFGLVFTEEAPITTMGWRLAHIIDLLKEDRCATYLGLAPEPSAAQEWIPSSADQARQMVRDSAATFRRYVEATDDASLDVAVPRQFNNAAVTRHGFILHIVDEVIHHGAEVGLLRDLWRASQPKDEFVVALLRGEAEVASHDPAAVARTIASHPDLMVEAAATARWAAIPLLADLGFPLQGSTGRSALHHVAARGDLALAQLLVERGADLQATDPVYRARPVVWAQFFGQTEVADYLERVGKRAEGQ